MRMIGLKKRMRIATVSQTKRWKMSTTTTNECDAAMRPFATSDVVRCELGEHEGFHSATLRNYAYPGSETTLSWGEEDRRTFHGEWPGYCQELDCVLPRNHKGGHAQ